MELGTYVSDIIPHSGLPDGSPEILTSGSINIAPADMVGRSNIISMPGYDWHCSHRQYSPHRNRPGPDLMKRIR